MSSMPEPWVRSAPRRLVRVAVVIALFALVRTVLLPVFARPRVCHPPNVCVADLKQVAFAVCQYSEDWDGGFPPLSWVAPTAVVWPGGQKSSLGAWPVAIYPYVKNCQVLSCPESNRPWHGEPKTDLSYGANPALFAHQPPLSRRALAEPAACVCLGDSDGPLAFVLTRDPPESPSWLAARHRGGVNLALADGHVKWYKVTRDGAGKLVQPGPAGSVIWQPDE